MRRLYSLIVVGAVWCSPALADDECKDVLINKVMDSVSIKKDTYYNTAVLSTLDAQTDD